VKGVGVGASEEIIEIRSNSKYQSFWDLLTRTDRKKLGKRAIEALCMVGGMDGLGSNRRSMSDVLPSFWDLALSQAKEADSDQISLFGKEDIRDPVIPDLEEFDDFSGYEFDYLGLYLTDHPLLKRFPAAKILKKQTSHSQNSSEKTWVVGILASVVPVLDKRDQQMARGRIETLDSRINLIVFASTYKRQKVNLQEGTVVLLLGKLEGADRMIVDSVHPVEDVKWMARVKLGDSTDDKFLEKIEKVLDKTKSGNCSIEIEMKREGKRFRLKSPHKVDPGDLSEGLSGIDHVEAELRPLDSK
ncbi:MAG: hypothetical protein JKX97_07475, partial [Candidatus Lindowbacteria bacterium]|nr:hypothetical protein [Candidatus Lindowbacteria bacterium]